MVAATEVADRGEASGRSTGTGARAKGLWNGEGEGEGGDEQCARRCYLFAGAEHRGWWLTAVVYTYSHLLY